MSSPIAALSASLLTVASDHPLPSTSHEAFASSHVLGSGMYLKSVEVNEQHHSWDSLHPQHALTVRTP